MIILERDAHDLRAVHEFNQLGRAELCLQHDSVLFLHRHHQQLDVFFLLHGVNVSPLLLARRAVSDQRRPSGRDLAAQERVKVFAFRRRPT